VLRFATLAHPLPQNSLELRHRRRRRLGEENNAATDPSVESAKRKLRHCCRRCRISIIGCGYARNDASAIVVTHHCCNIPRHRLKSCDIHEGNCVIVNGFAPSEAHSAAFWALRDSPGHMSWLRAHSASL
jgi:hypothetical protein